MRKLTCWFVCLLLALLPVAVCRADNDMARIPGYTMYMVENDDAGFLLELPVEWDCFDSDVGDGCTMILTENGVAMVAKLGKDYVRRHGRNDDAVGFLMEGVSVLNGKSTQASRILETMVIEDLPAVLVEMVDQGFEMIWIKDGDDLYFFMYEEQLHDAMTQLVSCFHVPLERQTPLFCNVADYTYAVTDDGVIIDSYTGDHCRVAVPAQIEGKPVIALADSAFFETDVTVVRLPGTVKRVGAGAFSGCNDLLLLDLGGAAEELGSSALESCMCLWDLRGTESLTSIGDGVFWFNAYLPQFALPARLEHMGSCNFVSCVYLEKLDASACENFVTSEDGAMLFTADGKRLVKALGYTGDVCVIPDGVEVIDDFAFADCAADEIILPGTIQEIGVAAFIECGGLKSVTIPGNPVSLGVAGFTDQEGQGQIAQTTVLIRGVPGSQTEAYAEKFGHAFEPIEP